MTVLSRLVRCALLVALFIASACGGGGGGSGGPSDGGNKLLIGAHYYVWFPQNFSAGYVRDKLSPEQGPLLGHYSSSSPAVAEQHIAWAADAGISFFTLDWWPTRPRQNAAIDNGFLRAGNIARIKFAIFYETIDLGYEDATLLTTIDEDARERFVEDMRDIAARYFGHPSYLRVNGRPVVFFYVTRTLTGLYREMFRDARAALAEMGYEPFFIGDEIYWVSATDGPGGTVVGPAPNVDRIRLFDAITAYNLYSPPFTTHAGYAGTAVHLAENANLYNLYKSLAPDVPIVPGVLPGYNDRGHRLAIDHYAIPREVAPGAGQGSFLREFFEKIGLPFADEELQMITITSWNEWNEDTQIEPMVAAEPSSRDERGGAYSQGYAYGGSGFEALDVVREMAARP